MVLYSSYTYQSRNPLKRWAHNSRFELAAELVSGDVLDYGCADGYFSRMAHDRARFINYEPYPGNAPKDGTPHLTTLAGLDRRFDCIACLEVLEHVPEAKLEEFFADVRRLLKPDGRVIVTVPVMIGPVGFLKIAMYLYSMEGHTITAAFRHLFGIMPKTRFLRDGRPNGGGELYDHEGFDYRALRRRLQREFRIVEVRSTPFRSLPAWLNSQVCFVCSGAPIAPIS